jgi:hypothetical protein
MRTGLPGLCCLFFYKEFAPAALEVPGDLYKQLALVLQDRTLVLQGCAYSHTPLHSMEERPWWTPNAGQPVALLASPAVGSTVEDL